MRPYLPKRAAQAFFKSEREVKGTMDKCRRNHEKKTKTLIKTEKWPFLFDEITVEISGRFEGCASYGFQKL